ncbi:rifin PIR protein,putative [Plasmodium sp. DRC-Itaito]|nr:rifin PIR protein,putative [Plasmodium sp. DRC-Itaito]
MKVHYTNMLLFAFLLNILLTSYHEHNKNTPYIEQHTPIYISRVLSEGDIQSSNYDKNEEMKSVMKQFDDRTSQRLSEYDERMQEKRQKRKEQRDKNVQKIIEKDKMEKSLAEKVEKGCLRCGCGLGGVAASVGLFGGLGTYGWKSAAVAAATDAGIEAGLKVGLDKFTEILTKALSFDRMATKPTIKVADLMVVGKFNDEVTLYGIFKCINSNMRGQLEAEKHELFFQTVNNMVEKTVSGFNESYPTEASEVVTAFDQAYTGIMTKEGSATSTLITGITASVVTIVVIVVILVIIYLILRYRRKKKMNKKSQYTILLNQ